MRIKGEDPQELNTFEASNIYRTFFLTTGNFGYEAVGRVRQQIKACFILFFMWINSSTKWEERKTDKRKPFRQ